MTGPELKLAIKPGAIPSCHTIPHRVPMHWKEQAEEGIKRDIRMAIIEELPANTPAKWCQKMVVTSKPGTTKPRRTVDMSALKTASYRLTLVHHHSRRPRASLQTPTRPSPTPGRASI